MRRLVVLLALAPALGLANAAAQSPAAIDSIVDRAIKAFGNQGAIDQVKMRARDPETDFSFDSHDLLPKPKRAR